MVEAQNKVVSIDAFRTKRLADRATGTLHRGPAASLSQRSIEHRERMLHYLRREAAERAHPQEVQGRLLL